MTSAAATTMKAFAAGIVFSSELEIEATADVDRKDWGGDDRGQKCKAHVVERRVPREKDESKFVDAPFASLERIGDDHEAHRGKGGYTCGGAEIQRFPLHHIRDVQLLVGHHVDGVPDQAPSVRIDQERAHA